MIVKQESECKPPIDYISNAHIYLWFQKVYRASEVQLKKQTLQNHACMYTHKYTCRSHAAIHDSTLGIKIYIYGPSRIVKHFTIAHSHKGWLDF